MPVTITYNNSKGYSGARQLPLADMLLIGPAARFPITGALVDSGADLVQVPQSSGVAAGLLNSTGALPAGATRTTVRTVGGPVHMIRLPRVSLEVEGIPITVDVFFHPNGTSRALLGRNALVALRNVGFNTSNWLWQ